MKRDMVLEGSWESWNAMRVIVESLWGILCDLCEVLIKDWWLEFPLAGWRITETQDYP